MPDLSYNESHKFWHGYSDPLVYTVISFMEAAEGWTLDGGADIEGAMTDLGNALEGSEKTEQPNPDNLISLIAHIKTSRYLHILQTIDSHNPGAASKIIGYAESNMETSKYAKLFLNRNIVFERLRLIGRIFSEERMQLVKTALEAD